jgi:hypothetical protein
MLLKDNNLWSFEQRGPTAEMREKSIVNACDDVILEKQ